MRQITLVYHSQKQTTSHRESSTRHRTCGTHPPKRSTEVSILQHRCIIFLRSQIQSRSTVPTVFLRLGNILRTRITHDLNTLHTIAYYSRQRSECNAHKRHDSDEPCLTILRPRFITLTATSANSFSQIARHDGHSASAALGERTRLEFTAGFHGQVFEATCFFLTFLTVHRFT